MLGSPSFSSSLRNHSSSVFGALFAVGVRNAKANADAFASVEGSASHLACAWVEAAIAEGEGGEDEKIEEGRGH